MLILESIYNKNKLGMEVVIEKTTTLSARVASRWGGGGGGGGAEAPLQNKEINKFASYHKTSTFHQSCYVN